MQRKQAVLPDIYLLLNNLSKVVATEKPLLFHISLNFLLIRYKFTPLNQVGSELISQWKLETTYETKMTLIE